MMSMIINGSLSIIFGNLAITLDKTSTVKAKVQTRLIISNAFENS